MKKVITIIITLLTYSLCSAQQQPQFTHYMYNTIAVNPAYAGSRDALAINLTNRNQWVGIDDAPRTTSLSIHSPLRNNKMGLGLSIMKDQAGWENFTFVYADYSYTIKTAEQQFLSFGIKAGFSQYKVDEELFTYPDVYEDPYFQDQINRWKFNTGVGLYYHSNLWYIGLSSPRIINNDYNKSAEYVALERNHYYLIGGYVFNLGKHTKFRPSFSTKYTKGTPVALELSAHFLVNEKFWFGASYRYEDAFGALFDMQVTEKLRAGYAYEYTLSDLQSYTSGSHEIILIYEFKMKQTRYKSPRYF